MYTKLILFGAGGHAVKMAKIARSEGAEIVGYISTEPQGTIVAGWTVLGNIDYYLNSTNIQDYNIHIGIGENAVRYKIFHSLGLLKKNIVSIISSKSIVSEDAIVVAGTSVVQNAIIQNNVKVGKCCIIDTGAIIDHDTTIGDFVNISPNTVVCSHVKISNGVFIGAGSTIIDHISIGENSLIGAGSVVVNNIEPNVIVFGNPAKFYRKREFSEKIFK